ncbi:MAG TPA: hypothetical protein VFO83_07795 [Aggregicoccus sp.]|nr:hypothetical protein [Aggregicoccus sp.]
MSQTRSSKRPEARQAAAAPHEEAGALAALQAFVAEARSGGRVPEDFGDFERQLHARVMAVERELVGEALSTADVDAEAVCLEGLVYRRVVRCEDAYLTAAGPVRVMRSLYRHAGDKRTVCPLELRLGLVEGRWTPLAAQQAAWVVAHLTPACAEECFERLGNQTPSRASLDRLPKALSARWEAGREEHEDAVRAGESVPAEAASVAVSLDGILTPMREGGRAQKRATQQQQGLLTRGAAGYREVGCATLSFFDKEGDFLRAVRLGRMPEVKKKTLKAMLRQELLPVLQQRPGLTLVKLADGTHDNWDFLAEALPPGVETVDFFHAAEHLNAALGAVYGEGSVHTRARFEALRLTLLEVEGGAGKVIAALARLVKAHPHANQVKKALNYFRTHRARMQYAQSHAAHLPVGSGCVEAACKSLVTRRLKGGGMRWGPDGGQAILTLRSLQQSDRFDAAWALLSATYKLDVTTLANVVALRSDTL